MFNNQHYATKGVVAEIPNYLQAMMWFMAGSLEVEQDYLQVFKLKSETVGGVPMQKLIHTQEQPPYNHEMLFEADSPVTNKVYIIDDETHSTMLLSEEY